MDGMLGEIRMFTGNFAPKGWRLCDGSLLSIGDHTTLFSVLGTTWGGDGRNTFALPDLRGRIPNGVGQGAGLSNRRLGDGKSYQDGRESHLEVDHLPEHRHAIPVTKEKTEQYGAAVPASSEARFADPKFAEFPRACQATDSVGGSAPHANLPPYRVVHYLICVEGLYPSRS